MLILPFCSLTQDDPEYRIGQRFPIFASSNESVVNIIDHIYIHIYIHTYIYTYIHIHTYLQVGTCYGALLKKILGDHASGFPLLHEVLEERFRHNSSDANIVQLQDFLVRLDSIDCHAAHPISPKGLY